MTVYLDLVVFLNFSVDLLLLLAVNRLSGCPDRWGRLLSASLLGGIYSGLCLIPELFSLGHPLCYLLVLLIICIIAFGVSSQALRQGAVFLLLSLSLGGMALAVHKSRIDILILEAGFIWLLTRLAFGTRTLDQQYLPVTLTYQGKSYSFPALVDTGNQLRDPVSGDPVLVISEAQAHKITGLSPSQISDPLGTILAHPLEGLRIIPYSSVGTGRAMMLALSLPQVTLGKQSGRALVGFAPQGLHTVDALTGGSLC